MKNTRPSFYKKPAFWIAQLVAFAGFTYAAVQYYPKAFPIVDLQIKMNRLEALKAASELACAHNWGPEGFRQSASFDSDEQTQTFVELTGGGSSAFAAILKEGLYSPYTWSIRHFAEGKTNETYIRFTPKGDFYGFVEKIPEEAPGKALKQTEALAIAEAEAVKEWHVRLNDFKLVENSDETRLSHRIDHTFVYERPDKKIGDGTYRLKLVVSGDRLSELEYFVKIPDSFTRKYAEMRSSNNTIAAMASVAMVVLYLLGGCGLGLFFLFRKHWVIWKTPMLCGLVVASFQLLEQVNHLPLMWMSYDTALSSSGFLLKNVTTALISFFVEFLLLSVSFMAAESLSRKAFPQHPQLWKVWDQENASSPEILGRTVGGYLTVGFFFAFVVFIYLWGTRLFGWWSPSDTLFNPDGLATYCPWFTSVSNSLHAGFWEESLFRAVPLASAALLGQRYGKKKLWIALGFVIQVLVFASAHANYPAQPSYARVVELIIPSCLFGGLYLAFGLLPGIILHYTFDVVSFSIPIFAAHTPRIWMDQVLIIVVSLLPLWIVLRARVRVGSWVSLKPKDLNGAWKPAPKVKSSAASEPKQPKQTLQITENIAAFLSIAAIFCLGIWLFAFHFKNDAQPLEVKRNQAIRIARQAVSEMNGSDLGPAWQAVAGTSTGPDDEASFVWKTQGASKFHELIGNYLQPPLWLVRFVRFDVDAAERAEEYQVFVSQTGSVYRLRHLIPEQRKGKTLSEDHAHEEAVHYINKTYLVSTKDLKDVSSNASKLPDRKDWDFRFSDSTVHLTAGGEARIGVRVAGNQVSSSRRFIFVPEEWSRNERNKENILNIIRICSAVAMVVMFLIAAVFAILSWTEKKFNVKTFKVTLASLIIVDSINFVNNLPAHFGQISTEQPVFNQMVMLVAFGLVKILFFSGFCALLIGHFYHRAKGKAALNKRIAIPTGYSVGIIATSLLFGIGRLFAPEAATLGRVGALDSYLPWLAGLAVIDRYMILSLLFVAGELIIEKITRHWTQNIEWVALFSFLMGFCISGVDCPSVPFWIVMGLVAGVMICGIFHYLVRSCVKLIPLMAASIMILLEFRQMRLAAYVGSSLTEAAAILVLFTASYLWYNSHKRT